MTPETARERLELDAEARWWAAGAAAQDAQARAECPTADRMRDAIDVALERLYVERPHAWERIVLLHRAWAVVDAALDDLRDLGPALAADVHQVLNFAREDA